MATRSKSKAAANTATNENQRTEPKDTRANPATVVKDMSSKSKAIRALAAEGYETREIAKMDLPILKYDDGRQIRYQHVRNVLTQQVADVEE